MVWVFKAEGITRYYSDDYLKAVYVGVSKRLNSNMKKHFPKPVDEARIAQYYEDHIASDSVDALINAFAVPTNLERNKNFLCAPLARQVVAFINSKDNEHDMIPKK